MENLLRQLSSTVVPVSISLKKGEPLKLEGENAHTIVFVEKGNLVAVKNGHPVLIRKNEVADLHELFCNEENSFFQMVAPSGVKLKLFNKDDLESQIRNKPKVLSSYINQLLCQLNVVDEMINILKETSRTKRLLLMILLNVQSEKSGSRFFINKSEIKWISGISNVSVRFTRKVLNKLEKKRLIEMEGDKMVITDIDSIRLLTKKEDFLWDI